ncbi:hypothetical protein ACUW9N_001928 [Staphylococcus auricularis]|uniref:Uncharacterized protein n=1 Tax=Staphylococcus auricularis TaxID=29379 RepID=A0AAP8PNY6_9STAP|nr:hypothetical protein [Staphylococcus auricularis]MDC6328030.1 hypothetical protein [Staphylococcus auricularis]MDN4532118.1 hypothetical protein [Staphylococcus auricularis]PNZ65891.1 hypothetical protein CD158_10135 [Staphylococcus auricularis]SQJ14305.1 Uncharacterised protein [Staphylococcus auricularis]BCU52806.1 hypothetical protein JCM2421_15780 [Staphylococcus auricularis]
MTISLDTIVLVISSVASIVLTLILVNLVARNNFLKVVLASIFSFVFVIVFYLVLHFIFIGGNL